MKIIKMLSVAYLLLFQAETFAAITAAAPEVRAVMVMDKAICIQVGRASPLTCFGKSANDKAFPVWSKDGIKIAYIERSGNARSLARLVVADTHGQTLVSWPIQPVTAGEIPSGMRAVESVEWIGSDKIVVSGSINPSTTEYLVFDANSGLLEHEFNDDGFGAAFTSDGKLRAYVTGAPHFTRAKHRAPKLLVNDAEIVDFSRHASVIAGQPLWSSDNSTLAVPMLADLIGGSGSSKSSQAAARRSVLVWNRRSRAVASIDLPFMGDRTFSLAWQNASLIVAISPVLSASTSVEGLGQMKAPAEIWQLANPGISGRSPNWKRITNAPAIAAKAAAVALRSEWRKEFRSPGAVSDVDLWCPACELAVLPRRARDSQ